MKHPNYHDIGKRFRRKSDWCDGEPLAFAEEGADLYNLSFHSANAHFLIGHSSYRCEEHDVTFAGEQTKQQPSDVDIPQNIHFRYPLVREHHAAGSLHRHRRCLILLHGLNEHSFTKYLPWAYHIWEQTKAPVILFPLTFHINRVFPAWGRHQQESLERRRQADGNENTHRFNAVISERLESYPERFFWGAMQSYHDLLDLVRSIRAGHHRHFAPGTRVDLFGFSAGGFVALTLMLENRDNLFHDSRGVLFASGTTVRNITLSSPLIVDLMAEMALMKMYVKHREKRSSARMMHWFHHHPEGEWLNTFCGLMPDRERLEHGLCAIAPRLLGIANMNDQVMPAAEMLNTLQGVRRNTGVRVVELPLGIHENPFAIPDYHQPERNTVLEFLSEEKYGKEFCRFIECITEHLG